MQKLIISVVGSSGIPKEFTERVNDSGEIIFAINRSGKPSVIRGTNGTGNTVKVKLQRGKIISPLIKTVEGHTLQFSVSPR